MDNSRLVLRPKQGSAVPPRQVSTLGQSQLPSNHGNTTRAIDNPDGTPNPVGEQNQSVSTRSAYNKNNTVHVSQPHSNSSTAAVRNSASFYGVPTALALEHADRNLLLGTEVNFEKREYASLRWRFSPTSPGFEGSRSTLTCTVGARLPMSSVPKPSLRAVSEGIYQETLEFTENTLEYVGYNEKFQLVTKTFQPDLLAECILRQALRYQTPLPILAEFWSAKLRQYNQSQRQYAVAWAVLNVIHKQDPNLESRKKKREEDKKRDEMTDSFRKHKVRSDTEPPVLKYAPTGITQLEHRKIATLKKPAVNRASYNPLATGQSFTASSPTHTTFVGGSLSSARMPTFGQSGSGVTGKAPAQPGSSPVYNFAANRPVHHYDPTPWLQQKKN